MPEEDDAVSTEALESLARRLAARRAQELPAEFLNARLAVKEGDELRAASDRGAAHDISGRDWRADGDMWSERMQPGDELWSWSTPPWTWQNLCGRGGLAIVRDGKPIDHWMTVMN